MDLINLLPHKRNTAVTVNGHTYQIDREGVAKDIQKEDAAKLLQNVEAWRPWDGKTVAKAERPAGARIGLIGNNGEQVDTTKTDLDAQTRAAQDQFEAKKRGEANPPPSEAEKFEVPEDGDWPDPTDAMPIEYLRQMAEAYEVKHSAKTGKKDLIKKITAKMYPDGK